MSCTEPNHISNWRKQWKASPTRLSTAAMIEQTEAATRRPLCRHPGTRIGHFQEETIPAPSSEPTPSLPGGRQLHLTEAPNPGRLRSHQRSSLSKVSECKITWPCSSRSKGLLLLPSQQRVSDFSIPVLLQVPWGSCPVGLSPRVHPHTRNLLRDKKCNTPFSKYVLRYVFRFFDRIFWFTFYIYFCFMIIYAIVLYWIWIRGLGVSPTLNRGPNPYENNANLGGKETKKNVKKELIFLSLSWPLSLDASSM